MVMLFLKLLNMSINASILVLIVLVFRLIFKKAPKWINCILWALVGIRLVIPFSFESKASLIPREDPIPTTIVYQLNPQLNSPSQAVNEYVSNSLATSPYDSASKTGILLFALGCIWLIGLIIMILYSIISYAVLRNKLKTSTLYAKGIKQSDSIASPFVLGVFKPIIYIPYSLSGQDLEYVISHEKTHIKRKDFLWKPLGFLILSIHWFNPVIWIAYIMLCRDIEAACDEKVISNLDELSRKGYSLALLNCSVKHKLITACPVAFGETGVKSRIKGIVNYKKPAFWIIVVALVASVIVAVCFITNPKNEKELTTDESSIANVGGAERNDKFVMRATVTEVGNGYMLVTPVDGSWELSSSDCFNISLVNMPASPEPIVGDVVEIEHNGVIQELYPASFSEVFSVTVISEENLSIDAMGVGPIYEGATVITGVSNLLGYTRWEYEWEEYITDVHYGVTVYSADDHTALGRWFGFSNSSNITPEMYAIDIDGDGNNELICNCQYGGDGAERCYIYRNNNGNIEQGWISSDTYSSIFDGIFPSVGAIQERYDPEYNVIRIIVDGDMVIEFDPNDSNSIEYHKFVDVMAF